jgi:hypothetical protein
MLLIIQFQAIPIFDSSSNTNPRSICCISRRLCLAVNDLSRTVQSLSLTHITYNIYVMLVLF